MRKLGQAASIFATAGSLADWNCVAFHRASDDLAGAMRVPDRELIYQFARTRLEIALCIYLNRTAGVLSEPDLFKLEQFAEHASDDLMQRVLALEAFRATTLEESRAFARDCDALVASLFAEAGFDPIPPYYASDEDFAAALPRVAEWAALIRHIGVPVLGMPEDWVDPILAAIAARNRSESTSS